MITVVQLALVLCAGHMSPDTSLTAALLAAVDTAASDEEYRSIKDRLIYVDVDRFLALAGNAGGETFALPVNRKSYDEDAAIAICQQKDESCTLPGEAYVRIFAVARSGEQLKVRGGMRYFFPYTPQPGVPIPRGLSDTWLRTFIVTLERTAGGWKVSYVLTEEAA